MSWPDCSERTGKPVAQENPEATVELMTTNKSPRTCENVQGNLLQNLRDHLQLTKLCSNVGTTKTVANGTLFHDPRRCRKAWYSS